MDKTTTVLLFYPEGGSQRYEAYQITHADKDTIGFTQRQFHGDEVAVTQYSSNLRYLIIESFSGPKDLLP